MFERSPRSSPLTWLSAADACKPSPLSLHMCCLVVLVCLPKVAASCGVSMCTVQICARSPEAGHVVDYACYLFLSSMCSGLCLCLVTYAADGLPLRCSLLGKPLDSGLDLQACERAAGTATCGDLLSSHTGCPPHKLVMQRGLGRA